MNKLEYEGAPAGIRQKGAEAQKLYFKEHFECNQLLSGSCRTIFPIHKAHHLLPGEQGRPEVFQPCAPRLLDPEEGVRNPLPIGDPRPGGVQRNDRKNMRKKGLLAEKNETQPGKGAAENRARNRSAKIPDCKSLFGPGVVRSRRFWNEREKGLQVLVDLFAVILHAIRVGHDHV